MNSNKISLVLVGLLCVAIFSPELYAQAGKKKLSESESSFGIQIPGYSKNSSGIGGLRDPYSFDAKYEVEQNGLRGRVQVVAKIEQGYHIFSTTQPKGGPTPTFIIAKSEGVSIIGPFTPDRDPEVELNLEGYDGVRVEEFYDSVTWTAPIAFEKRVADSSKDLNLEISGQVCKTACIPIVSVPVAAKFSGFYAVDTASGSPFIDPRANVSWTATLNQSVVAPGGMVELQITGVPEPAYHLYPLAIDDPEVQQKTLLSLTQKGTLLASAPMASSQPVVVKLNSGESTTTYHVGPVTWTIPIIVLAEKTEGVYPIAGIVGYSACSDERCDEPLAFQFSGEINVGVQPINNAAGPVALAIKPVDFQLAQQADANSNWIDNDGVARDTQPKVAMGLLPLLSNFSLAMLGGFILNFMPCVLPVIGLKVMSFVGEAGGNPRRSSILNIWYSAGLVSVFIVLAAITIAIRVVYGQSLGWGAQYQIFGLRLGLIILLFVMALSFLGVWEIPIPGFATSGQSVKLSQREGVWGAFSKGVITTIIATPCSGPLLGSVFGLLLTQPPWVIALMYLGVGLGMAMPYLLIAAYPAALNLLPKPGAWMETLKQVLAFPLLMSAVWFMISIDQDYRIAVLCTLVVVGFGCWLIGRVPAYAELRPKAIAWTAAIGLSVIAGWYSFKNFGPHNDLIAWQPYNEAELRRIVADGKPVLIDFTATWCGSCQFNLFTAIETKRVAQAITDRGVVPMLADWSKYDPTVTNKLRELNSNSIPVLAIYPAGKNSEPIVLRDSLSEGTVVTAIEKASRHNSVTEEVAGTNEVSSEIWIPGVSNTSVKSAPSKQTLLQ